jgi:hypothetical protein
MAELLLPKQVVRVRFPSLAPLSMNGVPGWDVIVVGFVMISSP